MRSLLYKVFFPLNKILDKVFYQNTHLISLVFLILDWFLTTLKINKLEGSKSDDDILDLEWEKTLLHFGLFWFLVDYIFLAFLTLCLNLTNKTKQTNNMSIKVSQLNNNNMYIFNNSVGLFSLTQTFLYGVRSV
jgi:hypothetical protein